MPDRSPAATASRIFVSFVESRWPFVMSIKSAHGIGEVMLVGTAVFPQKHTSTVETVTP